MKKLSKFYILSILFMIICLFSSCMQVGNDDGQFRTVPTTNNPNNLPPGQIGSSPLF